MGIRITGFAVALVVRSEVPTIKPGTQVHTFICQSPSPLSLPSQFRSLTHTSTPNLKSATNLKFAPNLKSPHKPTAYQTYVVVPNADLLAPLPNEAGIPWTAYVGAAGMPGQTAYMGWKEYARAKKVRLVLNLLRRVEAY